MTNRQKLEECLMLLRDIQKWGIQSSTFLPGPEPKVIHPIPDNLRVRINEILERR